MNVRQRVFFDPHETHRLRELEGVKLASFRRRAIAMAIDLALLITFVCMLLFSRRIVESVAAFRSGTTDHVSLDMRLDHYAKNPLVQLGILLGYFGLATYLTNGKTLGKWAMRIRVLSTVHEKMNLFHSLERGLGYLASSLEFGFGFMQYFINPNHRCVHDRIAETIVVEEKAIRRLKRMPNSQI